MGTESSIINQALSKNCSLSSSQRSMIAIKYDSSSPSLLEKNLLCLFFYYFQDDFSILLYLKNRLTGYDFLQKYFYLDLTGLKTQIIF